MRVSKLFILIIIVLAEVGVAHAQSGTLQSLQKVKTLVQEYNHKYPKQKVYLQTDKETYHQDENIWIKAYVFSGENLNTDTLSKNLYVELWSPKGIRVKIFRLKLKDGIAYGNYLLPDTLEQGIYQLRSFTDIMMNIGSEFYFNKNIRFYNTHHSFIISPKEARKNRKSLKIIKNEKEKFEVFLTFESKIPVEGYNNRVYYWAHNMFDEPVNVEVSLNSKSSKKTEKKDNLLKGIGYIDYNPESGEKYELEFRNDFGYNKKIDLPEAQKNGITGKLNLVKDKDEVELELSKPYQTSNDPSANRYFVLGHANNYIYFTSVVDLRNDTLLTYPTEKYKGGILTFTILSNRFEEEANFKCFIPADIHKIIDVNHQIVNDSVFIGFLQNGTGKIKAASLSIELADVGAESPNDDFISDFYFNSDQKGEFADSMDFSFSSTNKLQLYAKAYPTFVPDWDKFFLRTSDTNQYKPEKGVTVEGRIVTEILSIPLNDASVRLEVLNRYNDIYETTTNRKGQFGFTGFEFYDTLQMKIIARKRSGRKGVLIELRNDQTPELNEYYGDFFLTTVSTRDEKQYRIEMGKKASEEASRKEKELNDFYKDKIHGRPDYILYGKDLPENMSVYEAITGRVPGVHVSGGSIIIRGVKTILGSTDPLILVDDVPTDVSILHSIYIYDVERVEFLKGPSTSIYGIRGGNGVIAVYTKTGEYMKRGEIEFTLVGYQKPENFEISKDLFVDEDIQLPKTLLWIPKIQLTDKIHLKIKKPANGKFLNLKIEGIDESDKPFSSYYSIPLD